MMDPRQELQKLLGDFAPKRFIVQQRTLLEFTTLQAEQIILRSEHEEDIRAILTGPKASWRGLPAVLYCHAHGNRYDMGANELLEGRPSLCREPYGPALARQGIVAMSIDMPCFGLRNSQKESELSKRLLFRGQTLFGLMLSELAGAWQFLSTCDGVDPARIGVFGFSMGATHAFWLAALAPKLRAVAHTCSFADLDTLVNSGAHDLHGLYMTVPGLLRHVSTGKIAALVAPRPQLACMGLLDPLTPSHAVGVALKTVSAAYAAAGADSHFKTVISKDSGHQETEEMRHETLAFFKRWL